MNLWLPEWEEWGRDIEEFRIDMDTLLYLEWMANRDLLCSTGNSAQYYVAAWIGGEFEKEWRHVCVWLKHFAAYLMLA